MFQGEFFSDLRGDDQAVLAGPAAVGEPAIIGVSLDVDSLLLFADPALSKNCCTHPEAPRAHAEVNQTLDPLISDMLQV